MKKSIAVIFCLVAFVSLAWSDEAAPGALSLPELTANVVPFVQLDIMASTSLFLTEAGIAEMRKYSLTLAPYYRDFLFSKYGRDPWVPAITNVLTGGIGSFMMGDPVMGAILQGGMASVYAVLFLTLSNIIPRDIGFLTSEIGGVAVTVAGAVWPFVFAASWNAKLSRALGK